MTAAKSALPPHLQKYAVDQDYSRYTPVDQAVWRFIMRQLRAYLGVHAHECYLEGLEKTGIETDTIPHLENVSARLKKFGWQAVAVSGFIPPAAFMELQASSFLPIASDMRALEHLLYTPAPDIVHEAAGHAPILVDPAFADYLRQYAQVASHAIIGKRDMDQYEAIRILSDLKEDSSSSAEQIAAAEAELARVNANMGEPSEAALLSRMNWWTAEYGLIGSLENPRIFGAGLLSSVGEARSCLQPEVKKIPLTVDCINYAYDITERQPQLFVTPTFENLGAVLGELSERMAFKMGGVASLERAVKAETVNTVVLNNGLQIAGVLKTFDQHPLRKEQPAYLQFNGPTQLAFEGVELPDHSSSRHPQGFGSPIGFLQSHPTRDLCDFTAEELATEGFVAGSRLTFRFDSGVAVEGVLARGLFGTNHKLLLLTFTECTVSWGERILFQPEWGEFDMAVGSSVVSVSGGPADRVAFGETEDFVAKRIPRRVYSAHELEQHALYAEVRRLREQKVNLALASVALQNILVKLDAKFGSEWLLRLEILELALQLGLTAAWVIDLQKQLGSLARKDADPESPLRDGLKLLGLSS